MIVARVLGTVVATRKDEKMAGVKFQVVQQVDMETLQPSAKPLVAIDAMGAGPGELVMCAAGSSARQTELTTNRPVDLVIMAIIDTIDIHGKTIFNKAEEG